MRTIKTLLKIVRKEYNKTVPFHNWGICDLAKAFSREGKIDDEEYIRILQFLEENKPKNYAIHNAWYFSSNKTRVKWLDRHIKKLEKKVTK